MPDASRPNSAREKHDTEAVAVGIRVRPLLPKDIAEGSRECLRKVPDEPQVVLGLDRAFTFDHVFEATAPQDRVYAECMDPLMQSVLSGHNATVLAYGQTGSGKTHTMGSSATSAEAALQSPHNDSGLFHESVGLIPRALHQLFLAITDRPGVKCTAKASFIEIYKEEVLDLLSWTTETDQLATLPIREENGIVSLTGLRQRKVSSVAEAMNVLTEGARSRSTGATAMNATSSRSHAIFTLSLELTSSGKTVSPKVNFVDLAGSERAKRTGASGERLQEGIQINKGLLALGNVINSLCERQSHVPYRDSKLTRLLQDSLGGNSRTLMLACVSPADADLEETLNTLKYANRARQIRNKPLVVQDPVQAQLAELQELVAQLQLRLAHYEGGGSALPSLSGSEINVPAAQADSLLMKRVSQLEAENEALRRRLTSLVKTGGRAALTDQSNQPAVQDVLARESSPLANVPENGLCALSHEESFSKQTSAEEDALAEEQLEEELEFQRQQGGLSEQLQGLDETLALKQALLKLTLSAESQSQGGDKEEVAALQSQLNQLEAELHGLSKERETLITQVETLRKKSVSGDEESRHDRLSSDQSEKDIRMRD
ncbi:hypothetical protein AB1Y20_008183 [Prymnesium parvum]|uniref:Kinesin motor domain-containing protein n=1 Tax=Prymnesium parvum TaxID=97485 RepID=A0AB34ITN0_PRYPA